jgi:hypothetical protein
MEFGMAAGIIIRPDSVRDLSEGKVKIACSPESKQ